MPHAIAQSVVATWQCMSNKSPPFILSPEMSLGLRLAWGHSYGLILELHTVLTILS